MAFLVITYRIKNEIQKDFKFHKSIILLKIGLKKMYN